MDADKLSQQFEEIRFELKTETGHEPTIREIVHRLEQLGILEPINNDGVHV
jgi:hypothetical protein